MSTFDTIIRFFQEGGLFMYPIALVMAAGLAVVVERFLFLRRARLGNAGLWTELQPLLRAGKYPQAHSLASQSGAAVGRVIACGLARLGSSRRREDIETAMEEGLMEAIPRLERRTHYLATFANIATLLGLLGTIIGLIQAFQAVAYATPAEKAGLLSSSISVAMNTTAFGLIVAIPLLLAYAYLQSRTTEIIDGLEMAVVRFLNLFGETGGGEGA